MHLMDEKTLLDHGGLWVMMLVLKYDECKGRTCVMLRKGVSVQLHKGDESQ